LRKPYERYSEVFIDEGDNDIFAVTKEPVKQKWTPLAPILPGSMPATWATKNCLPGLHCTSRCTCGARCSWLATRTPTVGLSLWHRESGKPRIEAVYTHGARHEV